MKRTFSTLFVIGSLFVMAGCSKDSDDTPDCETGNFAVLKVNFGMANVAHGIIISFPGGGFREKLVAMGKSSDTVRLFPGDYPISISSRNNNNQSIQDELKLITVAVCENEETSVPF